MKKLGFALAAMTAMTLAPTTAFAKNPHVEGKVTSILYSCNMDFRATGKSIYIGLGWSNIKGRGTISCYDLLHGTTEILPIKVRVKGPGAGLGVTGLVISGVAAGVGVQRGPEDLIGRYLAVRANAAVGVGAGAAVGLRVSKGGITVDLSVQGETGLGVGVDLLSLKIEPDGDRRIEAAPPRTVPAESVVTTDSPAKAESAVTATAVASAAADADDDADAESESAQAEATAQAEVVTAPVRQAPRSAPVAQPASASAKSNIVYLQEGQPLEILDAKGKVIQRIYLKQK